MRLHNHEHNEQIRNGIIALAIFLLPLGLAIYFSNNHLESIKEETIAQQKSTQEIKIKNTQDIEEIRMIQGNKEKIDRVWLQLKRWAQGVINQVTIEEMIQAGFNPPVPITSNAPGAAKYNEIEAKSAKTEYLRLLRVVNNLEKEEGLAQVRVAKLNLPPATPPYLDRPTYLNIELIIATPSEQKAQ